jgi:leader peptidase (prepilin peptidase) / N-methyltransferase
VSVVATACVALLGALLGALVPRPAYRLSVPYGEPARPGCGHCDRPFPAGSRGWLTWSGRCPGCGTRLGPRRWLTASSGALAFGALTWVLWPSPLLPALLFVAAVGLLLAPIDLAVMRLPDRLVAVAFAGSAVLLTAVSVVTGDYRALLRAVLAAAAMAGGYLLLALVPGGHLGLGDVKLAGVLGLSLGWLGWGYVLAGAALPHLVNGPVVLFLLLSGRARRGSSIPLGPALLAGAFLAVVLIVGWQRGALVWSTRSGGG